MNITSAEDARIQAVSPESMCTTHLLSGTSAAGRTSTAIYVSPVPQVKPESGSGSRPMVSLEKMTVSS